MEAAWDEDRHFFSTDDTQNPAPSSPEAPSCPSEDEEDPEAAPRPGTSRFDEVVAAGCQGFWRDLHDWGREYDCDSTYGWTCDECPVVVAKEEAEYLLRNSKEGE